MKCPNCRSEMKSKSRDYEYAESGLNNVVLKGITVHECKHCGEMLPEISNVKRIHKWIAEYLLSKGAPLTGEEFRFLRKAMGKSAKQTALSLAVNPVSISRWENNKEKIGPQSDRLFRVAFILDTNSIAALSHATILLKHAREILRRAVSGHKKLKSEKIVITPQKVRQEHADAHD